MSRPNNNRKGYKPAATGYSAQGIKDVTSAEGKAMLDEEFRRIDQSFKNLQPQPPKIPITASSGQSESVSDTPPKVAPQKLSVKHNGINVIQNITENVNFEDTDSVLFDVIATSAREAKIQARAASDSLYKAKRVGEILYSEDGRTFRPEWPLTSLETGIILTRDGIIMIAR